MASVRWQRLEKRERIGGFSFRSYDTQRTNREAVADAYDEVKHSRAQFRSALSALTGTKHTASSSSSRPQQAPKRAMYDAEADEDE